ncbi:PREDICTED: probable protein phosphatase 2C 35 [Nicotiana attenuata]|uniref:protein-serine/threonine phosphatase n=1 Tax=Nicotiana attenuata TaxID=49451 RepID=A0A314KIY0_NICAT|nr:PREDICTED: probable protein phosphatase 2C 35 [Nicotiana attenuata]OIT28629.1 putative protein phosphatase 2c 35 [Nicotiana attenuata]
MGCVHGKCCCRYPGSSDGDNREDLGTYAQAQTHILAGRSVDSAQVPSHNFKLEYAVLTQRGFYPESPEKENQDSYCIRTQLQGNPNVHFFGVFDGHGQFGTQCSLFVRDRLVEILSDDPTLLDDPVKAYNSAFLRTNEELHSNSDIDDSMSGTTAITALLVGDMLYVANVGDSRAVLSVKEGNRVVAKDLSSDQTPFRKDECERVKSCGARVLSVDQVEGLKDPDIQSWGDEETEGGDPPRLWVQNGMYPGTAFTRSVGDSTAESIGVVAVPEVSTVQLTNSHPFFVIASDGVFEFLSSQTVVDMVNRCADPRDACSAIAGESYKLWLDHENRTDDITIIIVHIKALTNSGGGVTAKWNGGKTTNTQKETSEIYFSPCASEGYRSVMSEFSDVSCCHPVSSLDHKVVVSSSLG